MKASILILLLGEISQYSTALKLNQVDGSELVQLEGQISRGDEQWEEAV
jgi:hypothetical protein